MPETPSVEPSYNVVDDRASDPAAFAADSPDDSTVDQSPVADEWRDSR